MEEIFFCWKGEETGMREEEWGASVRVCVFGVGGLMGSFSQGRPEILQG